MPLFSFDVLDRQNHATHGGALLPSIAEARAALEESGHLAVLALVHEDTDLLPVGPSLYHYSATSKEGSPLLGYLTGSDSYRLYRTLRQVMGWTPEWIVLSTLSEQEKQAIKDQGIPQDWQERYLQETTLAAPTTVREETPLELSTERQMQDMQREIQVLKHEGVQLLNEYADFLIPSFAREIQDTLHVLERVQYADGVSILQDQLETLYGYLQREDIYLPTTPPEIRERAVQQLRRYVKDRLHDRYSTLTEVSRTVKEVSQTTLSQASLGEVFMSILHTLRRFIGLLWWWILGLGVVWATGLWLWMKMAPEALWPQFQLQNQTLFILLGWAVVWCLLGRMMHGQWWRYAVGMVLGALLSALWVWALPLVLWWPVY